MYARMLVGAALAGAPLIAQPLLLDAAFPAGRGPDDYVRSVAVQPDGRIVIAGEFTNVHGVYRPGIARLLANGALDPTFQPAITNRVLRVQLAPDGGLLLGGYYTNQALSLPELARLLPDGRFDPDFALPPLHRSAFYSQLLPAGPGRYWVTGSFTNLGGRAASRLAQLKADGSVDPAFSSPFRPGDTLNALVPTSDGRLIVAGAFTNLGGVPGFNLARLNADGSVDATFRSPLAPSHRLNRLTVTPDGRLIALWLPAETGTSPSLRLVRLLADGSLDPGFAAQVSSDRAPYTSGVTSIAATPDAGAVIAGFFTHLNGVERPGLGRLHPDGSTDLCFDPGLGLDGLLLATAVEENGSVIVGGTFGSVEGQPRRYLARLRRTPCEPGTIEFGYASARVNEDAGQVIVSVVRRGGQDRAQTVQWIAVSGSAHAGQDFTATTGRLRFAPGEGVQSLTVPVHRDTLSEGEESFSLGLFDPTGGAALGARSRFEITLVDAAPPGVAGAPDTNFVAALELPVIGVLPGPDGTWIVALSGSESNRFVGRVRRLRASGAPDPAFAVAEFDGGLNALARLEDGSFLVGGPFEHVNGLHVPKLARFRADGSLDASFVPLGGSSDPPPNARTVHALLPQADGALLAAGDFQLPGDGNFRRGVVRWTATGALDLEFGIGLPTASSPSSLIAGTAGDYLVGLAGGGATVARLAADGTRDARFVSPSARPAGTYALALERGGAVLAGGLTLGNPQVVSPALVRLNHDGRLALDLAARAGLTSLGSGSAGVRVVLAEPDGRLLVGGALEIVDGPPRRGLLRLHPEGRLDLAFDPGLALDQFEATPWHANRLPPEVRAIVPLPEGGWLVGGGFGGFGAFPQPHLVKLRPETVQPPGVRLLVATNQLVESAGRLRGWVVRSGDASQPASVRVVTEKLDAQPGVDFESLDLAVDFAAGEWSREFAVPILDNTAVGLNVAFRVALTNASPGLSVEGTAAQTVLILEDDVNVDFAATDFAASEDAGEAVLAVTRYGVAGGTVAVRVRAGNFEFPTEFAALASGGTRTNYLRVPVADDAVKQGPWVIPLRLEVVSGGAFAGPQAHARVAVQDNDFTLAPARGVAGVVNTLASAPGGGVYLAGRFTAVHGVARPGVARLLPNGEVDPAFAPAAAADGDITAMVARPDGRLVIAGGFTHVAGVARHGLAQLNAEGSLDPGFDPGTGASAHERSWDPDVLALLLQPDGRLLVGGKFTTFDQSPRMHLARLEADGRVDPNFAPPFWASGSPPRPFPADDGTVVRALAHAPSGGVWVAGSLRFAPTNLAASAAVVRLASDGRVESSFAAAGRWSAGAWSVAALADGRLLVGGRFYGTALWPGETRTNWLDLRRFLGDGASDPTFAVRGLPGQPVHVSTVRQLLTQADGRAAFLADLEEPDARGALTRASVVGRLNPDGAWDASFHSLEVQPNEVALPGASATRSDPHGAGFDGVAVRALAAEPTGRLLVAGAFDTLDGVPRRNLAHLESDGRLLGSFGLTAQRLANGGVQLSLPAEVPWPYALEASTDLTIWQPLHTNATPWQAWSIPVSASADRTFFRAVVVP